MKPTSSHPPAATPRHGGHHDPAELDNVDVDHEHSDINIRAVLGFATGLALVVGVVIILMWGVFAGLESSAASRDPQLSPLAMPAGQLPPEPRLLTNEPVVLRDMRAKETATLEGYGWVDQGAGVARIPIDEAKKKIVERGLPSRADAVSDPRIGTSAPAMGESSAGRVLGSRTPQAPSQPAAAPAAPPAAEHKGH